MIAHTQLGNNGRLGNQLFQIASTMGIAAMNGHGAGFPSWEYAPYFRNRLPEIGSVFSLERIREPHFHYKCMTFKPEDNIDLHGYLQSEKYFKDIEADVRKQFEFSDLLKTPTNPVTAEVWNKISVSGVTTCAVHLRFGDYVGNSSYVSPDRDYYYRACKFIQEQFPSVHFLVFTDDPNLAKNWLYLFPHTVMTGNKDIEDLYLMTLCDHMICANSSFSWWGAWLGETLHKIIIRPDKYFAGDLAENNEADLWPERWLNVKDIPHTRYPMKDVTITIPVMYDSDDRIENLNLIITNLQANFDCEILVMEQGLNAKFDFVRDKFMIRYDYIHTDDTAFHRTKLLNDMAKIAQGDIIFNWDADCLINPLQVYRCVEMLRNKEADVCFPYNGWFSRIERSMIKHLDNNLVNIYPQLPGEPHGSVGGCIAWNKDKYFESGGENENFISYGAEDVERVVRIHTLELNLARIDGPLIHINHYVGANSSTLNPFFYSNEAELQKIKSLNKEQLQEYVSTWPWKDIYSKEFFEKINAGSIASARAILPKMQIRFHELIGLWPKRIRDIGCGQGAWLKVAQELGLDTEGIDGDYVKQDSLLFDGGFMKLDLNTDTIPPYPTAHIVLCLEVAEHLSPERSDSFINELCTQGDFILFSAAIPGQNGNGHINEQWQSCWAERFKENGFEAIEIRHEFWENPEIEYWYRQNMILYCRSKVISGIYSPVRLFDVVHPEKFAVANAQ